MAKPTEDQIRAFEKAHKSQYLDLVTANRLWIKLFNKHVAGKPKDSKEYKSVFALGNNIAKNAAKWYVRQYKLETKGKVPAVSKEIVKYFLSPKNEAELIKVANTYLDKKDQLTGLGFIPLIIWGVIILIAAFTAYEITDELNTTAEEKGDLMRQTQATLKDLQVNPEQAAAIISSTQEQASADGGGLFGGFPLKLGLLAAGFYFLTQHKTQNGKKD
jgi:hypothetical protein